MANNIISKKTIGDVIREIRESKNISQRELAYRINVSNTAIYKIEKNKTKHFDPQILSKIADALGVTVEDIIQRVDWDGKTNRNTSKEQTDIPIEELENFLEDKKILMFEGKPLPKVYLRFFSAFLKTLKKEKISIQEAETDEEKEIAKIPPAVFEEVLKREAVQTILRFIEEQSRNTKEKSESPEEK